MQRQYQQKGPEQITNWQHTVVRNHTVCRQFYTYIPLAKPGVKAFVHLSLKLPRDCPMWEVYRFVSASRNSVGQFITVTQVLIMQ